MREPINFNSYKDSVQALHTKRWVIQHTASGAITEERADKIMTQGFNFSIGGPYPGGQVRSDGKQSDGPPPRTSSSSTSGS